MVHRKARLFATGSLLTLVLACPRARTAEGGPRPRWLGVQADVGVPDGAGIGLAVRPGVRWARLEGSYTYNLFASGVRGGITLDPFDVVVAPALTIEGGEAFSGELPGSWFGLSSNPRVNYQYANLHLGLGLGRRDSWRLFIRGGATLVHAQATDLRATSETTTTTADRLDATAKVLGTAKVGFVVLF